MVSCTATLKSHRRYSLDHHLSTQQIGVGPWGSFRAGLWGGSGAQSQATYPEVIADYREDFAGQENDGLLVSISARSTGAKTQA